MNNLQAMKTKYRNILIIIIAGFIFNSCGLFLQKTGVKNYSIKGKIDKKEYNDYQYDFIYLTHLLEIGFPLIDSIFPKNERTEQQNSIIKSLSNDNLENKDFVLNARKYLSNFDNQHTSIYLKSDFNYFYPYKIHISNDKWYLLNIDKKQDSLFIGEQIEQINGIDINEIEKRLFNFTFAENKINKQYQVRFNQFYKNSIYLKEINLINKETDELKISFTNKTSLSLKPINEKANYYKIDIPPNEITKKQNEIYTYKLYPKSDFGYLQFNSCHDSIDVLEGIESYVKPWLQPLAKNYARRQFRKEKPSKQIAPYYNSKHPVFQNFIKELIDSLNTQQIGNLIIDLRNNSGGNLTLGIQLIYFLTEKDSLKGFKDYIYTSDISQEYFPNIYNDFIKTHPNENQKNKLFLIDENQDLFKEIKNLKSKYHVSSDRPVFKGKIYILSNYRTGSAAAMLTTLFQDNGIGIIIGTSVGNNPTGATTYTPMRLPNTNARISIATTYKERPNKKTGKVQIPDYWIEYSMKDILTGNDPFLNKATELINTNANTQ